MDKMMKPKALNMNSYGAEQGAVKDTDSMAKAAMKGESSKAEAMVNKDNTNIQAGAVAAGKTGGSNAQLPKVGEVDGMPVSMGK